MRCALVFVSLAALLTTFLVVFFEVERVTPLFDDFFVGILLIGTAPSYLLTQNLGPTHHLVLLGPSRWCFVLV